MTTRATLANGDTFDYDEETEAHPTHVNDQPVMSRVFVGPTPPGAKKPPGVSVAQQRAELQAQLDALGDDA